MRERERVKQEKYMNKLVWNQNFLTSGKLGKGKGKTEWLSGQTLGCYMIIDIQNDTQQGSHILHYTRFSLLSVNGYITPFCIIYEKEFFYVQISPRNDHQRVFPSIKLSFPPLEHV